INMMGQHHFHIDRGTDTTFGDNDAPGWYASDQLHSGIQCGLESSQVAVVDPDERGGQLQCELELVCIVYFYQYPHAKGLCCSFQHAHLFKRAVTLVNGSILLENRRKKCSNDQQYTISSHCTCFINLIFVQYEVLA